MKIFNIALIGVGGLGIRHFQALLNLNIKTNLYLADISVETLKKAEGIYNESSNVNILSVNTYCDIAQFPDELDLVIIATSSNVRRKSTENLMALKKVKYIVFEKVLFPCIDDYAEIQQLLDKNNVSSWVNCNRRMFDGYKKLKKLLENEKNINVSIKGSNWGLGCNSIHMIDWIAYVSGEDNNVLCNSDLLDDEIIESKRKGYIEFTGSIVGKIGQKATYTITSLKNGDLPLQFEVFTDNYFIRIKEYTQTIEIFHKNNDFSFLSEKFFIPYQSQLTNILAENILLDGFCELPSLKQATALHIPIINAFLKRMNKDSGTEVTICPIT